MPIRNTFRNLGAGTKRFFESNTLVSKFAIVILVLIGFVFLLRLGIKAIQWLLSPTKSPYLHKGLYKNTKEMKNIPQNPAKGNSKTIIRSVNERLGLEFTWSCWVYISGLTYKSGSMRHIFSKGNGDVDDSTGMMLPNNAPGLYLHPKKNSFVVVMNTYKNIDEEIVVNDIPLNKWLCVMIRVEGNILDVYVNGTIASRRKLSGVPKQNYGDVWVTANGGFDGNMADLHYFDYALSSTEIQSIVNNGPDMSVERHEGPALPHYFALQWYFNNAAKN